MVLSASYLFRKKKSPDSLSKETGSPLFILWAFTMMSLSWAWRNILSSLIQGKTSDSAISLSTFPAPTLSS